MDSFATRDETLAALGRYPELAGDVPARLPPEPGAQAARRRPRAGRVAAPTRRSSGARPATATSTRRSRTLGHARRAARARLPARVRSPTRQPRRGARPAHRRAGSPASEIPFLMEVVDGHRGRPQGRPHRPPARDGRLVLRETAQTPAGGRGGLPRLSRRWRYFNTNNLWVDLRGARADARRDATACSACR